MIFNCISARPNRIIGATGSVEAEADRAIYIADGTQVLILRRVQHETQQLRARFLYFMAVVSSRPRLQSASQVNECATRLAVEVLKQAAVATGLRDQCVKCAHPFLFQQRQKPDQDFGRGFCVTKRGVALGRGDCDRQAVT